MVVITLSDQIRMHLAVHMLFEHEQQMTDNSPYNKLAPAFLTHFLQEWEQSDILNQENMSVDSKMEKSNF